MHAGITATVPAMPEARRLSPDSRRSISTLQARSLLAQQWGVADLGQLGERGLGSNALSRLVERGFLARIYPRVYAIATLDRLPIEASLLAALLYAGPDAALSHTTAAWWWQLIDSVPRIVHVTTPHRRLPQPGLRLHRPRSHEQEIHRGLAVTPIPRTLVDLASVLSFRDLRRAVAEADHRGLLDPEPVAAAARQGRRGSRALRRALSSHLPELADAASPLEERFVLLCERHGIPMPKVNERVAGFKVDALWRARRVIVELDGHQSHAYPAAAERDRGRELVLRSAGFNVLRYTWQQVVAQPELVVADLRRTLAVRQREVGSLAPDSRD
jgi:hypothetical protein